MGNQVLLVEDSPTQALRLQLLMERLKLKVAVAWDGAHALYLAATLRPDVVVLDVNLPDIDGFRVCHALKERAETATTPVIMLTVKDGASDTLAGLDSGADAYIPKDDFAEVNLRQALWELGILPERTS